MSSMNNSEKIASQTFSGGKIYYRRSRHYYNTEDEKQDAIKQMKREWYQRNKERQQILSLIHYYEGLVKKTTEGEARGQNSSLMNSKITHFNEKLDSLRKKLKSISTIKVQSLNKKVEE